jgi:integrase
MAKVRFTAPKVAAFKCPSDKNQAFLWDNTTHGLGLRCTPAGESTYIFQSRFNDKTLRMVIGSPKTWSIEDAKEKARLLKRQIDEGRDPRVIKADLKAADIKRRASKKQEEITVEDVWVDYCNKRRPFWGDLHYRDHINKAKIGGNPSQRRGMQNSLTKPGPLAALMKLRLMDLNQSAIESWAITEGVNRPSSARLSWRLLTVFLNWCSEQPDYQNLVPTKNPAKTKKIREALGKPTAKSDVLQREQLTTWFNAIKQIPNPVISASLQTLLITGARLNEVLSLKWSDVNDRWKGLYLKDKVDGAREIPLTPYVEHLLSTLPRRNEWVFSSPTSKLGRLSVPNIPHSRACNAAGINGLSLHGLRRSFSSLTEWLEIPTGVVAQIQGHKPSATAEKHYKIRPLELLRLHHQGIEKWILEQGGVQFTSHPERLKIVNLTT